MPAVCLQGGCEFGRIDRQCDDQARAAGAPVRQVGESKVNLGYTISRGSGARWGLRLMSEGVDLMREDTSASGLSFLAQGLRKLEDAVRRSGDHDRAEALARDKKAIAGSAEAFDQDRSSE